MKTLFASKMVYSSHKRATISSNQVCLAEACEKYPFMALLGFIPPPPPPKTLGCTLNLGLPLITKLQVPP